MANVKGVTLIGLVASLRKRREEALRVLPEAHHDVLDLRISRREWYPFDLFVAALRAAIALSKRSPEDVLEKMGRSLAHIQRSSYADLFEATGPVLRTGVFWETFHDTGVFELVSRSPGASRFELRDYPDQVWEMCALLGWNLAEVLELSGAKGVRVEHEQCVTRGDASCVWCCRW